MSPVVYLKENNAEILRRCHERGLDHGPACATIPKKNAGFCLFNEIKPCWKGLKVELQSAAWCIPTF